MLKPAIAGFSSLFFAEILGRSAEQWRLHPFLRAAWKPLSSAPSLSEAQNTRDEIELQAEKGKFREFLRAFLVKNGQGRWSSGVEATGAGTGR